MAGENSEVATLLRATPAEWEAFVSGDLSGSDLAVRLASSAMEKHEARRGAAPIPVAAALVDSKQPLASLDEEIRRLRGVVRSTDASEQARQAAASRLQELMRAVEQIQYANQQQGWM